MELREFSALRNGLILAADLRRSGADRNQLRRLTQARQLVRIRRGAYVAAAQWVDATSLERYLWRVRAACTELPDDAVLSHWSAAALHGLPILGDWPTDVHVIGARHRGGHSETGLRRHGSVQPPQIVQIDGIRVTSVARTVVDLARTIPFRSAVVAADRAQAINPRDPNDSPLTTREALLDELQLVPLRAGSRLAARVVGESTNLSGSPGETVSRLAMIDLGLPRPILQRQFVDAEGDLYPDFCWPDENSIGEFDGQQKYFEPKYHSHLSPQQILWNEKKRQDRLIAFTLRIARWDWSIALNPRLLLARLATINVHPIC